jgi:kumamolisin
MPQGSTPHETVVGGTTVFLASNGGYYKETAWGDPIEQWGGGGGYSTFFSRPSWQTGPGVGSNSGRGVPDVSGNGATDSPWDIFVPSSNGPLEDSVSGTSAATPFWAASTALIDEFLTQQHLKTVGFANPALYYFARNPSGLPAVPFHQVTEGNNLHYLATAGWNPATGLGSPDVAHLADDFEWLDKVHGGSA